MIDPKKTYRTRDGRGVRIYAVDGSGDKPVHGAIANKDKWDLHFWSSLGDWASLPLATTPLDLVEVKPRIQREVWLNVFRHDDGAEFFEACESKANADLTAGDARIACVLVNIDVEEGTGL